jgi:hypothetical protein
MKPCLNRRQKKLLRETALLCWFLFLLPVGMLSIVYPQIFIELLTHVAYFGIAVALVALTFLYGSPFTLRNKIIFLVLLSLGLLCGRAKFYGFFTMSAFTVFFFSGTTPFKFSFKNILITLCMVALVVLVAWKKISYYFVNPLVGAENMEIDMVARLMMYYTMPQILYDYFPFGCGFASYATYSSAEWYSDIYIKYGLDNVWGMSKSYSSFLADAYYPGLAQFGVAGIVLFLWFWVYVIGKAIRLYRQTGDAKRITLLFLAIGFLFVEDIAATTFIAQGGFFVMILLGLILSEMKHAEQAKISDSI